MITTMELENIISELNLSRFNERTDTSREVTGGYTSDLLSDVMGYASPGEVWITLQTHKNVAAIASLKELSAIILVKGLSPDTDMLDQATAEGIPVLGTSCGSFETSGKLYQLLHTK